jgi:hypothetical protein
MAPAAGGLAEEVFLWKLIGCLCWTLPFAALTLVAGLIAPALLRYSAYGAGRWLLAYLSALLVLLSQRLLLASTLAPPPSARWLVSSGWLSTFLSRAVLRYRTLASFAHALLFYASCVASGVVCVGALSGSRGGPGPGEPRS